MQKYYRPIASIAPFIGAWLCLLSAAVELPPNPDDLSDTTGLSAAILYTVALEAIGFVGIISVFLGTLTSQLLRSKSFGLHLSIHIASNLIIFTSSLIGLFVITAYVINTPAGTIGFLLYIGVIYLVFSATPKRIADTKIT
jgi:hypothetical protein